MVTCFQTPDAIVMDFFAGSCSTAQAVLEVNESDDMNLRSIMIQLPEATGREDFPTIADVGLRRWRAVRDRLQKDRESKLKPADSVEPDLGFRTFRLAESHYRQWEMAEGEEADGAALAEQLRLFKDPLREGWEGDAGLGVGGAGVIYEVAIKTAGYGLNCRIERVAADSGGEHNAVYRVSDPDRGQHFHITLDSKLDPATPRTLGLAGDTDLFVCRDTALDDALAANLALQCPLRTI